MSFIYKITWILRGAIQDRHGPFLLLALTVYVFILIEPPTCIFGHIILDLVAMCLTSNGELMTYQLLVFPVLQQEQKIK